MMTPIETTRDQLIHGDVFYFAGDPQYIREASESLTKPGKTMIYEPGFAEARPLHECMAAFMDVVIVHNTNGDRDAF